MPSYYHHSLALNDEEQEKFESVRTQTGFGIKKIFMAMINALHKPSSDETKGDGINKSSIMNNFEEE